MVNADAECSASVHTGSPAPEDMPQPSADARCSPRGKLLGLVLIPSPSNARSASSTFLGFDTIRHVSVLVNPAVVMHPRTLGCVFCNRTRLPGLQRDRGDQGKAIWLRGDSCLPERSGVHARCAPRLHRCALPLAARLRDALPRWRRGGLLQRSPCSTKALFCAETLGPYSRSQLPIPACGHPFVRSMASLRQLACVIAWAARALK